MAICWLARRGSSRSSYVEKASKNFWLLKPKQWSDLKDRIQSVDAPPQAMEAAVHCIADSHRKITSMLVVFSGLPGTGKTTIAQILARRCRAAYLRIDAIEQAILSSLRNPDELGALGYLVAYQMAKANLCLGGTVVVDAVNPLTTVREAWRVVAQSADSPIVEVEIVCSDTREHRRRVESRKADIPGHTLPTWDEVQQREYEPWSSNRLVIDSANVSANDAASRIFDSLELSQ